jgi:hypothetical protein
MSFPRLSGRGPVSRLLLSLLHHRSHPHKTTCPFETLKIQLRLGQCYIRSRKACEEPIVCDEVMCMAGYGMMMAIMQNPWLCMAYYDKMHNDPFCNARTGPACLWLTYHKHSHVHTHTHVIANVPNMQKAVVPGVCQKLHGFIILAHHFWTVLGEALHHGHEAAC